MTEGEDPQPATAPTPTVRVLLVDDHSMFRSGVRAELAGTGQRGGDRRRGRRRGEAVAVIGRTKPDVVLLDVHMPDGGGKAVLEQVQRHTGRTVPGPVGERCRRGRDRGDPGRRPRLRDQDDLRSRPRLPRSAGSRTATRCSRPGWPASCWTRSPAPESSRELDPELDQLTQREREVLRLLARGYAYKEIASRLFISVKTVETHVSSVLRKLQLSNRYELSRWATDRRLV